MLIYLRPIFIFITLFVAVLCTHAQTTYRYLDYIGTGSNGNGHYEDFNYPDGVAVDAAGNLYVSDRLNNCIYKYNSNGKRILKFGQYSNSSGPDSFNNPGEMAIDKSGNLYIANFGFQNIYVHNSAGVRINSWDIRSTTSFETINGLAFDSQNNLYVLCGISRSVKKYTSSGTLLATWGTQGSGNGQFNTPVDLIIDSLDNVYVLDNANSNIQKFSSSGNYITQWGTFGTNNGQFWYPQNFYIDRSGNICVNNNFRVQKFTLQGNYISSFPIMGGNSTPSNCAVDMQGNIYFTDQYYSRVLKFSSTGSYITEWGRGGNSSGQFFMPKHMARDLAGNIYVHDDQLKIQKFSKDGTFLNDIIFTNYNNFNDHALFTNGFAIDPYDVLIASTGPTVNIISISPGNKIQKIAQTGFLLNEWTPYDMDQTEPNALSAVAVDKTGNIYIADKINNRIQKYSNKGVFITQWGSAGTGNGQFDCPGSIAIDPAGNVFVVDVNNLRVQKFTSDGQYILKWGNTYSYYYADSILYTPKCVTTDPEGNVYVSEGHHFKKYTNTGKFIIAYGRFGNVLGRLNTPTELAADEDQNVYVLDYNDRVQKFGINTIPIAVLTNPTSNITIPENSTITLSAASINEFEVLKFISISINDNSGGYGVFDQNSISYVWKNIPAGTYSIVVKAMDDEALQTSSSPIIITVQGKPSINITFPTNNTVYTDTPSFTIETSLNAAGQVIDSVEFYDDHIKLGTITTAPYSFTVQNISDGDHSIKAKAFYNATEFTLSDPVEITTSTTTATKDALLNDILLYPNPVQQQLTITNKGLNIKTIEITDETGSVLETFREELNVTEYKINTAAWDAGLYFIRIKTEDTTLTKKIIKLNF